MTISNDERNRFFPFFFLYTVLFAAVSAACFFLYFCSDRTFFTTYDGRVQHIAALTYYGNYIRSILHTFFTTGTISIPLWDFNIGFGADVIGTLHYYAIGDPLTLLSAFVPSDHTEILYDFLIFLRLYLAGLFFLLYCQQHEFDRFSSLCGAFIYVFCGYTFYCAARHPFFINPMIYLPIMLIGIDRILGGKGFHIFALSVFFSSISSFYFFYMLSIMVFIYAVVRFFFMFDKASYSKIWKYAGIAVLGYIIGICMATFIFLPSIHGYFGSARTEEGEPLSFLYRLNYYFKFFLGFVAPSTFGSYSTLGYAAPVLPLLLFLFTKKEKTARELQLYIVLGILFFLFPVFGCLFNGGGYATNRWGFAFSFVIGASTAYIMPIALKANFKDVKLPFAMCIALSCIVFLVAFVNSDVKEQLLLPYAMLVVCTLILGFCHWKAVAKKQTYLVLIILSVIFAANFRFSKSGLDYLDTCMTRSGYRQIKDEMTTPFPIEAPSFFRVDTSILKSPNAPCVSKFFGTTYYWSIASKFLNDFYISNGLDWNNAQQCLGLKERADLYGMFNVKYVLGDDTISMPSSLSDTGIRYLDYKIYENKEFKPFGNTQNGEHFENMRFETNKIIAEITLENEQSVFLSIPYSKFWTAKIDGISANLERSNTAFSELAFQAGHHTVELHYKNAVFSLGCVVSFFAAFSFIILMILARRKMRTQ
ncbi:MAG: YfhO family protein [Treponema sp.]|nr:YfhO family protein [Treponema sp.]